MIYDLLQTYLSVIIPVGIGSLIIFFTGMYWILSSSSTSKSAPGFVMPTQAGIQNESEKSCGMSITIPPTDISAISGDDALSTQLDLARAYLESGRIQLAKKILDQVVLQGSDTQQQEAKELLSLCV